MSVQETNGYLDVENATLRSSKIEATSNIGIANTAPQHAFSVGSNLYIDTESSNVLTVDGNVVCEGVKVGLIEIVPSYDLAAVSNVGNVTQSTIQFSNATTGFVTTANIEVGTANLFVDTTTGRVGIGTDDPQDVTHIYKSGANGDHGLLIEQNNAGTGSATLKFGVAHTAESTAGLSKAGIFFKRGDANGRGDLLFCVDNVDDTNDVDTSNHALTIYRDGNVGIGKTDPGATLDVVGDVEISSNLTAASSRFSLDTNGTLKQPGENNNYIKLMKYFPSASNWKIATGSYTGATFQWFSIRAKMTRLDQDVETIQFNYLAHNGTSRVRDSIVIGGGGSSTQPNEIKVYNKTSNSTYEIYLQTDSATSVEVEITHRNSTIDDDYSTVATANNGAIDETGLTKIYDSGTTTDLRLISGNVGIGTTNPVSSARLDVRGDGMIFDKAKDDGTILSGLYNYTETQQAIDAGVQGGVGTITASTEIDPPPGTAGDVIAKFVNGAPGEAVTNIWYPGSIPIAVGTVIYFGVWIYATQNIDMEFFRFHDTGAQNVPFSYTTPNKWVWFEKTITSDRSYNFSNFRFDNNSTGRTVYLTGLTIRVGQSQNSGLPFTPRYSPASGKGAVFTTQNLVAKEAAIKTLTGAVDIGAGLTGYGGGGLLITKEGYVQPGDINLSISGISGSLGGNYLFQGVYDAYRTNGQTGGTMTSIFERYIQVIRMGGLILIRGYLPSRQITSSDLNYRFTWAELGLDGRKSGIHVVMNDSTSTYGTWSSSIGSDATYLTLTSTGQTTSQTTVNYNHLIYLLDVSYIVASN